jgi:hypothetical protein
MKMSEELSELFDIVAFQVPKHKSILYRSFLTKELLLKAVDEAVSKGANVISIRRVVKDERRA